MQEGWRWFCAPHGFGIKMFLLSPCVASIIEVDPLAHWIILGLSGRIQQSKWFVSWRILLLFKLSLVSGGNMLSTHWFCHYVRLNLIIWQFLFPEECELWFSCEFFEGESQEWKRPSLTLEWNSVSLLVHIDGVSFPPTLSTRKV